MKTIIITGSSSGIGFALAEHFGKKGYKVYGLSRKRVESQYFTSIATDVTEKAQVEEAIGHVLQEQGSIEVLINNAGMGMVGPVEDASKEEIMRLFTLNLVGVVQMMAAVLPSMRRNRVGQIINISSIGSEMGLPFRGFYSASKSAVDKVTEAIRYEVFPWNIEVCSLHLGDIQTNIADHRLKSVVSAPYEDSFKKVYALMNAHVDEGLQAEQVAGYIDKLLEKKHWKPHYYYGKVGQKIGIPLKWILPQRLYEKLMKKYSGI